MAEKKSSIIVEAKDKASKEFTDIFNKVNAEMGKNATAAQVLQKSYAQLSQSLQQQATAAKNSGQASAQQVQALTQLAQQAQSSSNSIQGLNQSQTQSSGGMKIFGANVVDVAAKLYLVQTAIRGAVEALQGLFEFGKLGAQVAQTEISFANMTESIGSNAKMLDALRDATRGTVSDIDLMTAAQTAMIGVSEKNGEAFAEAIPKLAEIAKVASVVNPALGSTTHLFESLTTGIKRQSPLLIDNTGLRIKLKQANDEYAESLGITVEEMTAEQKQMALLNATLEAGERLKEQAGGSSESLADSYEQLTANADNLKNALAKDLDPVIRGLVGTLNDAVTAVRILHDWDTKIAEATTEHADAVEDLNKPYAEYKKSLEDSAAAAGFSIDSNGNLIDKLYTVAGVTEEVIKENYLKSESDYKAAQATKAHQKETAEMNEMVDVYRNSLHKTAEEIEKDTEDNIKFLKKRDDTMRAEFFKELDLKERLLTQTEKINKKIEKEEESSQERINEIIDDANQKRIQIAEDAVSDIGDIHEKYADRITGVDKDISELQAELENKNPFISPETQRELEVAGQTADDLSKKIKELKRHQRENPTDEREAEIIGLERDLEFAKDLEADIKDKAREEERRNKILFRIQEKEAEKQHLQERQELEIQNVYDTERDKLKAIQESQDEQTEKIRTASAERVEAFRAEAVEAKEIYDKNVKDAMIDALAAIAPAGSKAADAIFELQAKQRGATDQMIEAFYRTRDAIDGDGGLAGAIRRVGGDMGNVIVYLNSQLASFGEQIVATQTSVVETAGMYRAAGFGNVGMRQHGGSVEANRPYIVGESGPELFIPGRGGGSIVPNNQMGGGITINISAQAFQGSQADAKKFAEWVGPIVLQYIDRNGGNANAVGSKRK